MGNIIFFPLHSKGAFVPVYVAASILQPSAVKASHKAKQVELICVTFPRRAFNFVTVLCLC